MSKKEHGTCSGIPQQNLRFGVDQTTADAIACFNKGDAEAPGYAFEENKTLIKTLVEG